MKNKVFWLGLSLLLVAAMLLASCAKSTTISTLTSTSTSTKTTPTTNTSTTTKTTTSTTQAATTTTPITGNWWDKLGKPQYGGEMVLRYTSNIVGFDAYLTGGLMTAESAWKENLFGDDWTLDPAVFGYQINWRPNQYEKGSLAESWEFTTPGTFVVHLRHGIHWQNIPPVNGREFTADDVVFHYDRLDGLGNGYTKPSPYYAATFKDLISVTATDTYTVVFKWDTSNQEFIFETLQALGAANDTEPPEAVKLWGDLSDWHHAIGTGPFILQDFVSDSSMTLIKNPNYWRYDERYPQNQLPYIDTLKILIIPDTATSLAAVRTGKIDAIDNISVQSAQSMQKTNPNILQLTIPAATTLSVDPRNDVAPFKDIRVREAMQMAIDLPGIASSYYNGTCSPNPSSLTSMYETGWGLPYDQWPQDLKDQYDYNVAGAQALLTAAGYPTGFHTDIVVDAAADMSLFQIVKSYFSKVGIDMDIKPMDDAAWQTYVRAHKQDALCASSNGGIGFSYEPLRQLQRYISGGSSNWWAISDPVFDAFYPKAMAATSVDDIQQVVRDANEYVARQHFVISLLTPNTFALYQPWLKGYTGQSMAISGGAGGGSGPLMLGFYAARFWIDQNLKKSMGY